MRITQENCPGMNLYLDICTKIHIPSIIIFHKFIEVALSYKTSSGDPLISLLEMVANTHMLNIYQFRGNLCSQKMFKYKYSLFLFTC